MVTKVTPDMTTFDTPFLDATTAADQRLAIGAASSTDLATTQGLVSGKNWLINCGIPINQRVFAGGALAAGVYGYDRWKAGTGGCNITISPTTGVFTHTSGPLQQVIEDSNHLRNRALTFSVEDLTGGSLSVSVGGATGTITAGAGRRSVTLTPTGSGDVTVQLTGTGVTYSRPQLEIGSTATGFEYRNRVQELILCQRYYRKSYDATVAPGTSTATGAFVILLQSLTSASYTAGMQIVFGYPMRAAPTVLVYPKGGGASGSITDDTAGTARTASVTAIGQSGFYVFASTVGSTQINLQGHWTAEAEL